jgi:hypothetical protein
MSVPLAVVSLSRNRHVVNAKPHFSLILNPTCGGLALGRLETSGPRSRRTGAYLRLLVPKWPRCSCSTAGLLCSAGRLLLLPAGCQRALGLLGSGLRALGWDFQEGLGSWCRTRNSGQSWHTTYYTYSTLRSVMPATYYQLGMGPLGGEAPAACGFSMPEPAPTRHESRPRPSINCQIADALPIPTRGRQPLF